MDKNLPLILVLFWLFSMVWELLILARIWLYSGLSPRFLLWKKIDGAFTQSSLLRTDTHPLPFYFENKWIREGSVSFDCFFALG